MEILFVSHKYPPSVGGMEKQSFELINGMKRYATVHTIIYDGKGSIVIFFLSLKDKILKACRQHPAISIIHFNDGLIASFCMLHKGYDHLSRTVTLHGLDIVFPNQFFRRHILPKFNSFKLIFAVSQGTAAACTSLGLLPERIVVVNNGVDATIATAEPSHEKMQSITIKNNFPVKGKCVLVAMGRPVKRKGFSWFIENVIPRLKGDFLFFIIGPFTRRPSFVEVLLRSLPGFLQTPIELFLGYPTDERAIRKLLSLPAVSDKVKHLGRLEFEEIIEILRGSRAFVMPNIAVEGDMEGFGLVCLEACLCGATVFAAKIDGIPDAIHDGKNGFLLTAGKAGEWADALNGVIADPLHVCLSKDEIKAYTFKNFSWEKMVRSYWEHFIKIS